MSPSLIDEVIHLLIQIPGIDNKETRDFLLRNQDPRTRVAIRRSDTPLQDVTNIVRYAAQGGVIADIMDSAQMLIQGTQLEGILAALRDEYRILGAATALTIRIVVVAMTSQETGKLDSSDMTHLQSTLQPSISVEEVMSCYSAEREDWMPLSENRVPVRKILERFAENVSTLDVHGSALPPLHFEYLSSRFLSENPEERYEAWDVFEYYGGIFIIDPISLYNRDLAARLLNSQLLGASSSRIGVVVLSPLRMRLMPLNALLETKIYSVYLEHAFNRFAHRLDPLYEFGVCHIHNMHRWLYTFIKRAHSGGITIDAEMRIREETGKTPSGIASRIFGGSQK